MINHPRKLRPRTTEKYLNRWAKLGHENALAESRGTSHYVYVVRIEPLQADLPTGLYVGSTGRTPEHRLEAHQAGERMSAAIFRKRRSGAKYRAVELLDEHVSHLPVWRSRSLSRRAERILAQELKALGHHVVSDQLTRNSPNRRQVQTDSVQGERATVQSFDNKSGRDNIEQRGN